MLNPDEIPLYLAVPIFIATLIWWRRLVIKDRRQARKAANDNR